MQPKISVIIPVYNGAGFVSDAIKSVFRQSYPAHEIIVVDDGSTDDTPEILESFKDKIIRKRIKNSGSPSAPRNAAIPLVTGDYVAFLDADDLWFENKLKRQVEFICRYPDAGLLSSNYVERRPGQKFRLKKHLNLLRSLNEVNFDAPLSTDPFRLLIKENFVGAPSSVIIKKEIIDKAGEFYGDCTYAEDYDYWLRCARLADFVVISDVLLYKRTHATTMSSDLVAFYVRHEKALKRIAHNMHQYIKDNGLSREHQYALARTYYYLGNSYFEAGKTREAFKLYFQGMLSCRTFNNFILSAWTVFKKFTRFLTFNIIVKEKIDIKALFLKYRNKLNIGRRVLKIRNYYNQLVYTIFSSSYKGNIPRLSYQRRSFEKLLLFILDKAIKYRFNRNKGYLKKGLSLQTSAAGEKSDIYELIARTFIGLGYYLIHNDSGELRERYLTIIKNGINPQSEFYWGKISSNQKAVENTSIIVALLLNREKLWEVLSDGERKNFLEYIQYSLREYFHKSNWLWFKIFHLLLLEKYRGLSYKEQIIRQLKFIGTFYVGDGWYNDGMESGEYRYDHYNSWAFHYYGLLFCYLAGKEYDSVKDILKERFRRFKNSYIMCFSEEGLPLSWGRSLIYRFGGLSCFGLGITLNLVQKDELAKIRRIATSTINEFFKRKILDAKGHLTMGYTRPAKSLLEEYSGEGSPYWALKAFSFLLLDENHPFWKDDTPAPQEDKHRKEAFIKSANLYIQNENGHCLLLNGGMNSRIFHNKYNRFAYSNIFPLALEAKYPDNLFVFLQRGKQFFRDTLKQAKSTHHNIMHLQWYASALPAVEAYTTIVPLKSGYILVNNFLASEKIKYKFCGFCITGNNIKVYRGNNAIELSSEGLTSKLKIINSSKVKLDYQKLPGSWFLYGESPSVPYLSSQILPGKTRVIICVQGGNLRRLEAPIISDEPAAIIIKNPDPMTSELKLKEKNLFYE